jgi:DNA-binding LacI/PurR family transcriptional regulator
VSIKKKTVRLRDIATKAGVSVNTVSRTLRNNPGVSEATKATIFQLAEELGYALPPQTVPDNKTPTVGTLTIGVLVQDNLNPFFWTVAQGIEQVLLQERANFLFGCSYRQESKERDVFSLFCQQPVDGIIIGSVINPEYILAQLPHLTIPMASLSQRFQECNIDYVVNDNYRGALLAMEHLISLGHTRIAHISGLSTQVSARERARGYNDALTNAGIPNDKRLLRTSDETVESGYYLAKDLLQTTEKLTAIFAYNDLVALGAFRAIQEANLQVPADISLVGYDDIAYAEFFGVPLTTVHQPMVEIGRKAAEVVLEKIRVGREHQVQQIILKPRLTIRSSTSICPEK